MIRLDQAQAPSEPIRAHIDPRHFQRVRREVDGIDARSWKCLGASDGDAARSRAHIQHSAHSGRIDPRSELSFDQLGQRGTRNQDARINLDGQAGEPGHPG